MGRPTKDTYYRQYFEGRKLNKLLYEAKNAHELTTLYNDFIEKAEHERKARPVSYTHLTLPTKA